MKKLVDLLRTEINDEILPKEVLDREIEVILNTGVDFQGGKEIDAEVFETLKKDFDAVVLATGTISENSERFGLNATPKGISC